MEQPKNGASKNYSEKERFLSIIDIETTKT
jgi:hypothetical protein